MTNDSFEKSSYQQIPQKRGTIAHESIDTQTYSSAKRYLQSISISSEKLKLIGKIDLLDTKTNTLIERKYQVKTIYDGYRYQLYAQYFCLLEMGYEVDQLVIHSLADNKRYHFDVPSEDETNKFNDLMYSIQNFSVSKPKNLPISPQKCANCIYAPLCDKALC